MQVQYIQDMSDAEVRYPVASDLITPALEGKHSDLGVYSYNPDTALLLSIASAWAYSDGNTMTSVLRRSGLEKAACEHISIKNGALMVDTNVFYTHDKEKRVGIISFRGTEVGDAKYIDVLTDSNVTPFEFPPESGAMVHGGFFRAVLNIWPDLMAVLNTKDLKEIDSLFITGHSLGGALAAMAMAIIVLDDAEEFVPRGLKKNLLTKIRGIYTYGQPMIGDKKFSKLCEQTFGNKIFRHVYKNDWVPHLPPKSTGKFMHFGAEYGNCNNGWNEKESLSKQASTMSLSLPIATLAYAAKQFVSFRRVPFIYSLFDHLPQNYVDVSKRVNPDAVCP